VISYFLISLRLLNIIFYTYIRISIRTTMARNSQVGSPIIHSLMGIHLYTTVNTIYLIIIYHIHTIIILLCSQFVKSAWRLFKNKYIRSVYYIYIISFILHCFATNNSFNRYLYIIIR